MFGSLYFLMLFVRLFLMMMMIYIFPSSMLWRQVTVHVKGKTECYECQPKPAPKTYPVCTITSTPSKVYGY